MVLHRPLYDTFQFNKYSLTDSYFYEDDMLDAIRDGSYCGLRNIAALATVVNYVNISKSTESLCES